MEWKEVIDFWFKECSEKDWFTKSDEFDEEVRRRFLPLYWSVVAGEREGWRAEPKGRLAEIIVLDQFARNMFRGLAQAFHYDPLALALAQEAIRVRAAEALSPQEKMFLYLPFMHSESRKVHERAMQLYHALGNPEALRFEKEHSDIIARFGRYPHRNAALGRASTAEEEAWMKTHPGF